MGAGLHGLNGVNPKVSIHLVQTYVTPRLLYGLEILSLTLGDIRNLELYFKKLLRQIQHLSDRTANAATYLRGRSYNPTVRESDSPIVRRSDSPTVR
jgi:hypothetical protein